ncbi:MAG: esterase/lipase family protein [Candidatus Hodarchaeales archaeon]|jgi:pimeloyl-ACP methyl ester carboxylesterase
MLVIDYQIIDAFNQSNLAKGILKRLPAYLSVSFNVERKTEYSFSAESPQGQLTGKTKGFAFPGCQHQWRIPIVYPGTWNVIIYLFQEKPIQRILTFQVPVQLFDFKAKGGTTDIDDYLAELTHLLPSKDEIQYVDTTSRFLELSAHWLQLNPELKLWRYIFQISEKDKLSEQRRFGPILMVHGFNSDFTTWNWLVRYFWGDGFRNLFAVDLYDDRLGVEKNAKYLEQAIDEILAFTNFDSICLIGHSLGGLIGRYFVKKVNPKKINILITAGAPHMCGLSRLWGKLFIIMKNAQLTERDVTLQPSSTVTETQKIFTEADFYQQTMVNMCGIRIRGGDGGFKFSDNIVPDMINLPVNAIHLTLIKNEETYHIIRNFLNGNTIIYKIRLLYIKPAIKQQTKNLEVYLEFKPIGKGYIQRYPFRDNIILENEPLIPQTPMIVFVHVNDEKQVKTQGLEVQIWSKGNEKLAHKEIFFALGGYEPVSDHFNIETTNECLFQFAVYSYRLYYESEN